MVRHSLGGLFLSHHSRKRSTLSMPRFCANLTLLFNEVPFTERFGRARQAGFEGVEVLFPGALSPLQISEQLKAADLSLALFNCPVDPPDLDFFGSAANPDRVNEFKRELERTLEFAKVLRPDFVHIMAGRTSAPNWRAVFCENLKYATRQAPWQAFTIEPINTADMPRYALSDFDEALSILDEVDAPNLFLQFDTYHAYKITGDIDSAWGKVASRAAHIQIGGIPDRHEPTNDGFNYGSFFDGLNRVGFKGWVSGEYHPKGQTEDGLSWLPPL